MIKNGIYTSMTANEYHASDAIGSTTIKAISVSPANHYFNKFKGSKSSQIGTAIHAAILEPELFERDFVMLPDTTRASKEYKEIVKNGVDAENILVGSEVEKVRLMLESSKLNTDFQEYIAGDGESELSIFTTCPRTGLQLKCRFDRMAMGYPYPVDVKSTKSVDWRSFSKDIKTYGYHIQAAYYLYVYELATGIKLNQFCFFAIENVAPHRNCMYFLDAESLELGRKIMFEALDTLLACMNGEIEKTQGMVLESQEIGVPAYVFDENEEEVEL